MTPHFRIRFALVALFVFTLAAAPVAGSAEPTPWDAARVSALATQLSDAAKALREAVRREPPPPIGAGQANAHERLEDDLRRLKVEAGHLAAAANDGKGMEETRNIYQRIETLRRDAAENARRMFLTESVSSKVAAAREPAKELAGFYGVEFEAADLNQRTQ